MTTLKISLPESMRNSIGEQIAKGGGSTASEYIRHLICQELERVAKTQLETLLSCYAPKLFMVLEGEKGRGGEGERI